MKNGLQKFGKFYAMVMPNIEHSLHGDSLQHYLSQMDGFQMRRRSIQPYMLTFLLPMLIAYTGGKQV